MKKIIGIIIAVALLLSACGQNSPAESVSGSGENGESLSWQEQYDLGVRYLSEGNYQEAIIAFTAAIEIDPRQAPVYVGRAQAYVLSGESDENLTAARADYETALDLDDTNADAWFGLGDVHIRRGGEGDYGEAVIAFTAAIELDPARTLAYVERGQAYVLSGETEENLSAAQADFEMAIELDDTNAEAWLGLADVYIRRGEYEKALEILREGLEKAADDQSISDKITEIEQGEYTDSSGQARRRNYYTAEGQLTEYLEFYYDELGRLYRWESYDFNIEGSNELSNVIKIAKRGTEAGGKG